MRTRRRAARWVLVLLASLTTAAGVSPRATSTLPHRLEQVAAAAPHTLHALGHSGRHTLVTPRLHQPATAATPAGAGATSAALILCGAVIRRRRQACASAGTAASSRAPPGRVQFPAY